MPGVARVQQDKAGGVIIGNLAPTVFVNNKPIAVKGAQVTPHGKKPHGPTPPVMVGCSSTVFANNIPVCRAGDKATCGHPTSGSGDVEAG